MRFRTLKDEDLIHNVNNKGCSGSFSELVNRHSGICYDVFSKYSKVMSSLEYDKGDIDSDKDIVLLKSINSFRSEKGSKFPTWLFNQMKFFCLNYITKASKMPKQKEGEVNQSQESFLNELQTEERAERALSKLKKMDDPRVFRVFQLRYFNIEPSGKKWKNIAKNIGVSNQTALNIHKRGLTFLRKNLTDIK